MYTKGTTCLHSDEHRHGSVESQSKASATEESSVGADRTGSDFQDDEGRVCRDAVDGECSYHHGGDRLQSAVGRLSDPQQKSNPKSMIHNGKTLQGAFTADSEDRHST